MEKGTAILKEHITFQHLGHQTVRLKSPIKTLNEAIVKEKKIIFTFTSNKKINVFLLFKWKLKDFKKVIEEKINVCTSCAPYGLYLHKVKY